MEKDNITEIGVLTQNIFQATQLLKALNHDYFRAKGVQIEFNPHRITEGIYENIDFSSDYLNLDKNILIATLETQLQKDKERLIELTEKFK